MQLKWVDAKSTRSSKEMGYNFYDIPISGQPWEDTGRTFLRTYFMAQTVQSSDK